MDHTAIFTSIYDREYWGSNGDPSYKGSSGAGSSPEFNRDYVPWLRRFLQDHNIRSVVDIGAGDFRCGPAIYDGLDIDYRGFDVVSDVVAATRLRHPTRSFAVMDCYAERARLPPADLCILKDVLQHWSTAEIYEFLDYAVSSKRFKTIMICNCSKQKKDNKDIRTGFQRQLSAAFFPLKRYGATPVFHYETKEVSFIHPVDASIEPENRDRGRIQEPIQQVPI